MDFVLALQELDVEQEQAADVIGAGSTLSLLVCDDGSILGERE
ncbi:SapB/AmfS family lanthipeptide [Actinosynnema pretiosum subsp. pretiosum]|uniref:Uncharacterized protein n=2 Tax=Actinosynnema TaxID=40566 RepID=C6WBQ9_ACTMD|nr:SapB/AmfS family lanthipeptide [Actinosynnema mirum]ACU37476.1 hypothetical protein Amir_3587 [Actinosynnema mirum DSM 43827]AXX30952.1 hypothetical protein APASM_3587 [Actinosynnema pretiosum subsp. pretiosum]QUF04953.1 SapB/AmfS family lanthipeptide [Actinosynnema pretiosum subsp. pretiosum]